MASSYKTVHYILPLESASLYCSSRIKLGAAVWYYDKTSDLLIIIMKRSVKHSLNKYINGYVITRICIANM